MASPTQCFLCDGVDDFPTIADAAAFHTIDTHLGIGFWMSRDYDCNGKGASDAYLVERQNSFSVKLTAGHKIEFEVTGAGAIRSTKPIAAETITFVGCVATESGADLIMELYINGDLNVTKTYATATIPADPGTDLLLGCMNGPAGFYKGTISSFFLSDIRVTAAFMAAIYAASDGQADGVSDTIATIVNLITEGVWTNDGTAGNATANGAVLRTWMRLGQNQAARWVIPDAETLYNTFKNWRPNRIVWYGPTIVTGDELKITNWDDQVIVHWYGTEYVAQAGDLGKEWVYDTEDLPIKGAKVVTLTHGLVQVDLA